MPMDYSKLFNLLEQRGITIYRLRKDGVVGTATLDKMRKKEGHIDTRSLESLCQYLNCQPGDMMEYVPDEAIERDKSQSGCHDNATAIKKQENNEL